MGVERRRESGSGCEAAPAVGAARGPGGPHSRRRRGRCVGAGRAQRGLGPGLRARGGERQRG